MRRTALVVGLIVLGAGCAPRTTETKTQVDPHVTEIEAWRAERQTKIGGEYSWFSVTGLFWLREGRNVIGSAKDSAVRLPASAAPPRAGLLLREGEQVTFAPADGAAFLLNEEPLRGRRVLQNDASENGPDRVYAGKVQFYVIKRGDRIGVRMKDPDSPARQAFDGFDYFPVSKKWRIVAQYEAFEEPKAVQIATVVETQTDETIPGALTFELDGESYALEPFTSGERLWLVFRDRTAGQETYGLGRMLYADIQDDGTVVLDFNKAYNPPCAFNDFTTCPIPRPANRLPIRVEAGEKAYAGLRVTPKSAYARQN